MWKPFFEGLKTPYDLGWFHGQEDKAAGNRFRYRPGCTLTRDELEEYREGYAFAYNQ